MNFQGVIIEESLEDAAVLNNVNIVSTSVEEVTEYHKTPWVKQWTLHEVEVTEEQASNLAQQLSRVLDHKHHWYADYKNDSQHYIIYADRVFHVTDITDAKQYQVAKDYGISLGIPEYQVDFTPTDKVWER